MMGAERRSMVMTQEQEGKDRLSRGGARHRRPQADEDRPGLQGDIGGAARHGRQPARDGQAASLKDEAREKIAMTMAGKAAEIYKYGPDSVSSARSATSSRRQALRGRWSCAGACPTRSAASTYSEAHEGYRGNTGGFSVSAHTKELIEEEVKRFIDEGYANASRIIEENAEEFERLAQGLLEYETLTGEEIKRVMQGRSAATRRRRRRR